MRNCNNSIRLPEEKPTTLCNCPIDVHRYFFQVSYLPLYRMREIFQKQLESSCLDEWEEGGLYSYRLIYLSPKLLSGFGPFFVHYT